MLVAASSNFAAASGTRYRVVSRASSAGGARTELELLVRPTAAGFYPKLPGAHTAQTYQSVWHLCEAVGKNEQKLVLAPVR
jgi:hypothetical protein